MLANVADQLPAASAFSVTERPPNVAVTSADASARPDTTTPAVFSANVTMSSPAIALTCGRIGARVSITTVVLTTLDLFPTASVTETDIVALPSAGMLAELKFADHWPSLFDDTVSTLVPQLTATVELASARPLTVTPSVFSAAFTRPSPDTVAMDGAATIVSINTVRGDEATLVFPMPFVTVAVMAVDPSAGMSDAPKRVDQFPAPSASTVLDAAPHCTTTLPLATAVPETETPACFSAPLTMSFVETAVICGASGRTVSTKTGRLMLSLTLPAISV